MQATTRLATIFALLIAASSTALAAPGLQTVFPTGATVGRTQVVKLTGSGIAAGVQLRCNLPEFKSTQDKKDPTKFEVIIPREAKVGHYDLWLESADGVSAQLSFLISNRNHVAEAEESKGPQDVSLNSVVHGSIKEGGDVDDYRFVAKKDQTVVISVWARRIGSQLRGVLEVFSDNEKRLKTSRGYHGLDPSLPFRVPEDGTYRVRVHDLVYSGGASHYYRLDIDSKPVPVFAFPPVVQRGKATTVKAIGWNLPGGELGAGWSFDSVKVSFKQGDRDRRVPLSGASAGLEFANVDVPGAQQPVLVSLTDASVVVDGGDNHSPIKAKQLKAPVEVAGQLTAGGEQDWYSITARRGEVFYLEAFGERINSPVDLSISVMDERGKTELAVFEDERQSAGGKSVPTSHLDPSGRWVAPADGEYKVVVYNRVGGLATDPRRVYRLSIRREIPDFRILVFAKSQSPTGINVQRGGKTLLRVVAIRERGMNESICVSAKSLPQGLAMEDVWLGPDVDSTDIVLSAAADAKLNSSELALTARSSSGIEREVVSSTVVRGGTPNGWGRLASCLPIGISGEIPLSITASASEKRNHHLYGELAVRYAPGCVVDVAVHVQGQNGAHDQPITVHGLGLPDWLRDQTSTIPAGASKGYVSFYIPPTTPLGHYSIAIQGTTTIKGKDGKAKSVTVITNSVSFEVKRPAFRVELDTFAPRKVKRGQITNIKYTTKRMHGFISKIHTELAAPGRVTDVGPLRGRGVTFVGQSESGAIQIIVNDDAPLGPIPFLKLYAVGVLEDQPIYHGSCFVPLEIVE